MNKQALLASNIVLFAIIGLSSSSGVFVSADTENNSINAARYSINQAFTNVLAAEKAGGNVTALLFRLSSAGQLLANAENAYQSGNLADVETAAQNSQVIADQVTIDAIKLRDDSLSISQTNFWLTLAFSVVGSVVFCCTLVIIWRWFKRRFMNKLLGMKPEVIEAAP